MRTVNRDGIKIFHKVSYLSIMTITYTAHVLVLARRTFTMSTVRQKFEIPTEIILLSLLLYDF